MPFKYNKKKDEEVKPEENLPAITPEVLPDVQPTDQKPTHQVIDAIAGDAMKGMKETLDEMEQKGISITSIEGMQYLFQKSKERMFGNMDNNPVLKELQQQKDKPKELGDGNS